MGFRIKEKNKQAVSIAAFLGGEFLVIFANL
jgi:hypothetical protein